MTARRAWDGPSCCFRHKIQRLNFMKGSVTVRRAHYGPSYSSVAKFRELFSVPNFPESKCFGTRHPRQSVVPMTVRRGIRRPRPLLPEINSTAQKQLNSSLHNSKRDKGIGTIYALSMEKFIKPFKT